MNAKKIIKSAQIIMLMAALNTPGLTMNDPGTKHRHFLKKNFMTDFCLVSREKTEFPCHRLVLASYSEYFEKLFANNSKEKHEGKLYMDHSAQVVGEILRFIYDPEHAKIFGQDSSCINHLPDPIDFTDYFELKTFADQAFFDRGNSNIEKVLKYHTFHFSLSDLEVATQAIRLRENLTPIFHRSYNLNTKLARKNLLLYSCNLYDEKFAGFNVDGSKFITKSENRIKIWHTEKCREMKSFNHDFGYTSSVSLNNDETKIVTTHHDEKARIFDLVTGEEIVTLTGHTDKVIMAKFSPDNSKVITASYDNSARLWDASSGEELLQLVGHRKGLSCVAFNANGSKIVTTSFDNSAIIWDANTGKLLHTLKAHSSPITSASFSPDGEEIITSSNKRKVIWKVATGENSHSTSSSNYIINAELSKDGHIKTISDEGVTIDDTKSNEEGFIYLPCYGERIIEGAFNPDDTTVALKYGSDLRIYPVAPVEFYSAEHLLKSKHAIDWLKLQYFLYNYLHEFKQPFNLDQFVAHYSNYDAERIIKTLSNQSLRLKLLLQAISGNENELKDDS